MSDTLISPAAAGPAPLQPPAPSVATVQLVDKAATLEPLANVLLATDPKSWLQSRTLWALGISAVASVAKHYGHTIPAADQTELVNDALGLMQYGGLALAALFRVLASKPLK